MAETSPVRIDGVRDIVQRHGALPTRLLQILREIQDDLRWLPAEALEPVRGRFDHLLDALGRVVSTKRRIVAGLKPPLLTDLGLTEALRSLIGEMEAAAGADIVLEVPDELPPLAQPVALALYRIAQEAIDNARRHAGARRIAVALAPAGAR
jgi:protein-histidine pros-kinase